MEKKNINKNRNSSVEFLKIIAIIMIIINHVIQTLCTNNDYIANQNYILNISKSTKDLQILILALFRYFGVWGNTIFFVSSGWYLLDSKNINIKKVITMIVEIWFVSNIILIFFSMFSNIRISKEIFIKSLIPNIASSNWYMTCYLLFYILHPVLNKVICELNEIQLFRMTSFLGIIYIGLNFLWEGILFYSPIILWIAIYCILAYLKKYKYEWLDDYRINVRVLSFGLFINVGMVILINCLGLHFDYLSGKNQFFNKSSNPFIIMSVIALFNIMRNMDFSSIIVNHISKLSLFIYIFHENIILRTYLRPYLIIYIYENKGYEYILFWVLFLAFVIFILSILIGIFYYLSVRKVVIKLGLMISELFFRIQQNIEDYIIKLQHEKVGEVVKVKEQCCGCSACEQICPQQCIVMKVDKEGFMYPQVDNTNCVNCRLCERVCPFNIHKPKREKIPRAYAVKCKDYKVRIDSSSGGFFSVIANHVIRSNGVVYGAAMDDDMKTVSHVRITKKEELFRLRGSKYVQSDLNNCYNLIKSDLASGCIVLFSGVPCQISGLKLFLAKDYDNLICVELICHGVPSPLLWERYIENVEKKYDTKVLSVNFREKRNGWEEFGLLIEKENGYQYKSLYKDSYLQMFLKNYCLRPSCYDCNMKKVESMADIAIADFWGIEKAYPSFYDKNGVSLVLIYSIKGERIFADSKELVDFLDVDFEKSIDFNPAYYKSAERPSARCDFYKMLNLHGYDYVAKRFGHLTKKERIIKCIGKTGLWQLIYRIRHNSIHNKR